MHKVDIPKIWITSGDPSGIGPYIIIKSLKFFNPENLLIFGSQKFYSYILKNENLPINFIQKLENFNPQFYNIFNVNEKDENTKFKHKDSELINGFLSLKYIQVSLNLIKELKIKPILITAPVSKKRIQVFEKKFYGHSEFLEIFFNTKVTSLMWSKKIKVALVTRHIPLKMVSKNLSLEKIIETTCHSVLFLKKIKHKTLNIRICALNPHSGESGLFGDEEKNIIEPAISFLKKKFINDFIEGPCPADSAFFNTENIDLIVSMYHDQGLIGFKTKNFLKGLQISLGLPILRISVSHGTAFNLLKNNNEISFKSMKNAIHFAHNILYNN